MTPDQLARLAVAETEIKNLTATLDEVRDDMKSLLTEVRQLRSLADNAKGGWRTLMMVGGIGTAIGGALVKFVPLIGKTP